MMDARRTKARVESVTPLTDSILQLILSPDEFIAYEAGQYLQILIENEALSFSVANAPLGSHKYELHIRHGFENKSTQLLMSEIKREGSVQLRLPLGSCDLSHLHPTKPILFIAGGTGFAPIKAMIEQLLADGDPRAFELFWGARSQSDLYMDDKVSYWQTHVRHFKYFSLLSDVTKATIASKVFARHKQDLDDWQFVMSGPFDMVFDTRDQLLSQGALLEHVFSDAFERRS